MRQIAVDLGIPQKEFRARLRAVYNNTGAIVIKLPGDEKLEKDLSANWPGVTYHVLDAEGDHFFRRAAEVFFAEMSQILPNRSTRRPFRIGVVSGRTTGGMIEAICNINQNWGDLMPLERLPQEIFIYALNVSQIDGYDHLKGNANVLAYQLAHRFRTEVKQSKVEAYGLSAKLLQTKQEVQRSDCTAETRAVLKYTDPERLRASLEAQGEKGVEQLPAKSQLDVVITGVGSIEDSLFREYLTANSFDVDRLQKVQWVVGDIAYCPVTRVGEPQTLSKDNQEWEFYRAISLEVLREMSQEDDKKVLVVAIDTPESKKTNIIHAAIAESAKFCNVLITDVTTADTLKIKLGR